MSLSQRAHGLALALIVCLASISLAADTIRVVSTTATVRLKPLPTAAAMLTLQAGTVLEDATREGEWYRVNLPPDANGFRRVGYVAARLVESLDAPAPAPVARASADTTERDRPVAAKEPAARMTSSRDTVAVMDFDYGTIKRWWSGTWDVGKGISDLMVDELVNGSSLRIIERKRLLELLSEQEFSNSDRADVSAAKAAKIGRMLGARYLIFGSITQFSYEEGGMGGAARLPFVGGVGVKTGTAHVAISARMIDSSTGEIVASANTRKDASRRNVTASGSAGGYVGSMSISSSQFLDTVLGEATQAAVKSTTESLLTSKTRREGR